MNTCRFCGKAARDGSNSLVKYGVRHCAHYACYLDHKSLDDLHAWQVGNFPFRLLKQRGLLNRANEIITAEKVRRDVAALNEGRFP